MDPIVAPGPPLSAPDRARFARQIALPQVGELGQRRLRAASVCVVGAGGLGSPAVLYLAAAGIGRIGVVDDDLVLLTNLNRQVMHASGDLGRQKVASAADSVRALDPDIRVDAYATTLTAANVESLLLPYDVVLDCSDRFETRYAVNDACAALGKPLVWGAVLGFHAQVSVFWSRPPGGGAVDLRDVFPEPPAPGEVPSCAQAGIIGALCGQVGSLMAGEAVKLVVGTGRPMLGRVLTIDSLAACWREVPIRRAEYRPAIPAAGPRTEPAGAAPGSRGGRVSAVGVEELARRVRSGAVLIDVRDQAEHADGHIPGSRQAPLRELRLGAGIPTLKREVPLVAYCSGGPRAQEAAELLRAAGFADVSHLRGGLPAWRLHKEALGAAGSCQEPGGGPDRVGRGAAHGRVGA